MSQVHKIIFPYNCHRDPTGDRIVIFFGFDFVNLPKGSNEELFIERTNQMLAYIERNFPHHRLLYQPHPNEKDEYTKLKLGNFVVGERTIADLLMWQEAGRIDGVFAATSWAAATAYSMGLRAGVFLDLLAGAVPHDAIVGWRSYFEGFPEAFFIHSFDTPIPPPVFPDPSLEREASEKILRAIGDTKTIWFMAADPAFGVRAAILANYIRRVHGNTIKIGLLKIRHPRWARVENAPFFTEFDEIVTIPYQWYTAQVWKVRKMRTLLRNILELRRLRIAKGDVFISFCHMQFSENAVLSWYKAKNILMTESRWYSFTYEKDGKILSEDRYRRRPGVLFFNYILEPLLRLHVTGFREYSDGKVVNILRYKKPLEKIYDTVFVFVPPV